MAPRSTIDTARRILLLAERAASAGMWACFLLFLIGAPLILPKPLLPFGIGSWITAFRAAEENLLGKAFVLYVILSTFLGLLMSWFARRFRRLRIMAEARMDERPAMLLLRSFRDTALQQAPSRVNPLVLAGAIAVLPLPLAQIGLRRGEERDLIEAIDRLFEAAARIMMLRPRSAPSAFTMFSSLLEIEVPDERWQEAVVALAHRSSAVLLLPSASAGVVREAELLRSDAGLLARTVVVLPPVDQRRFTWYQRHPTKEWSGVQEAWRSAGLNLPPYPKPGIAYVPAPDFSPLRARSLAGSFGGLVPAVAELLEPGAQKVPAYSAMAAIDRLTGRNEERRLWWAAVVTAVLTVAIVTGSAAALWNGWRAAVATERALIRGIAEKVTAKGRGLLGERYRSDPRLAAALSLYAWDHAETRSEIFTRALLSAAENSTYEAAPDFLTDIDQVRAVVPQVSGSLMVESDLYLRKLAVSPALRQTYEQTRIQFCLSGAFAFGTSGSLALACTRTGDLSVSYNAGKLETSKQPFPIRTLAIEGERLVWAGAANEAVVWKEGREEWRFRTAWGVSQIRMSPDARFAWVAGESGGVMLDLDRRARVFTASGPRSPGFGFSPSSRYFIRGGVLHDLATGVLRAAGSDEEDASEAVSSDATMVAIGRGDGALYIVDNTGKWRAGRLPAAVRHLVFLGETHRLAAAIGNQVILFDVDAARQLAPLVTLLESRADLRQIEAQLGPLRRRTRKLTKEECAQYFDYRSCPAGL